MDNEENMVTEDEYNELSNEERGNIHVLEYLLDLGEGHVV